MPRTLTAIAALALCAVLLPSRLTAQAPQPKSPVRAPSAKPKLTPQQKFALSILDQQSGSAQALPPAIRAFALLEIADGYQKIQPRKALATLRDAFSASQTISDDSGVATQTRQYLQSQIISRLAALDPAYCEQLIPQLAGRARATAIGALVNYYAFHKQFPRAVALLSQLGDQEFPYVIASSLMQELPANMAADRQNLFSQALASYTQHDHKDNLDDFAVLIARTWQGLPSNLVLQAIDEVLKQARESDADMQITVGAEKGSASFNSIYEYDLFQLMPALRTLDPERADSLLQESRDLQTTVHHFPNGMNSLDPQHGIPNTLSMRVGSATGEPPANDRYADELQRRAEQIVAGANKHPKQALAAIMSLPDFHDARAQALLRLADALLKTDPGYAKDALSELMKLIPSVERNNVRAAFLAQAGSDYLKLGDVEATGKVVDQGFKFAENLYAADTDAGDPNQAFKAEWPSTAVWRLFAALAARISPQAALQAINRIPDPEIQSLETIALAKSLLGMTVGMQMTAFKTRSGKNNYMMSGPLH